MSTYSKELPNNLYISLRSIFRNSLTPNEVILVKDGPLTPSLNRVIDKFQSNYPDILKVYELDANRGLAIAMNFAISKTTNDWIIRQDSDDFSHKRRFEFQMSKVSEHPSFFGTYMQERSKNLYKIKKVPLTQFKIRKSIIYQNPFNHPTMCFHKNVFKNSKGYPNIKFKEDWSLWIKSVQKYNNFNLSKVLVTSINSDHMIVRRRGLANLYSEFHIQKLCIQEGLSSVWKSVFIYFIRVSLLLLPKILLEIIYSIFLRSDKKKNLENDQC